MRRLADALAGPDPVSIDEVVARLSAIDRALPLADGIAWFTKLYLSVTEAVRADTFFRNPRFLSRLDVVFAGFYLAALRAFVTDPGAVPKAWAPLVEERENGRIAPIQFAFAGMNAHINRDLPLALVATCQELGIELEHAADEQHDFRRVNRLLAETEGRVKRWFATGFVGLVDVSLGEVDDRIAMWNVGRAREAAWVQAETLWALRAAPVLAARYLETGLSVSPLAACSSHCRCRRQRLVGVDGSGVV